MQLADSHNHIHFSECDTSAVLMRAHCAGVVNQLIVGIDPDDSRRALTVAESASGLYAAVGIHPQLAGQYSPRDVQALADMASSTAVAVGETGFDLYRTPTTEELQAELFRSHIDLARRLKLPLVIHDRQAHAQTLSVLDEADGWSLGGVMHCFSGDVDLARRVLDKGFYLSIPGVITYKNAHDLVAAAAYAPPERLLIETDAPYLSPQRYRGRPNEPAYLVETLTCLARIKEIDVDELAAITVQNFHTLFLKNHDERRRMDD